MKIINRKAPRNSSYFDKTGDYRLLVTSDITIADPGETIFLQVNITGYGIIDAGKIVFKPSFDFYNEHESYHYVGIGVYRDKNDKQELYFGGDKKKEKMPNDGGLIILLDAGVVFENNEQTMIFDDQNEPGRHVLVTEQQHGFPPITLQLKIKDNCRPGNHTMTFAFTYFNGEVWAGDNFDINILVRNILQRNETLLYALTLILTICGTIASIYSVIK